VCVCVNYIADWRNVSGQATSATQGEEVSVDGELNTHVQAAWPSRYLS